MKTRSETLGDLAQHLLLLVLFVVLPGPPAGASGLGPLVAPAEAAKTMAARAAYENPWYTAPPSGGLIAPVSTSFFGGGCDPMAGGVPTACPPRSGNVYLSMSSFGQPFGKDSPFPEFVSVSIARAKTLLYYMDADLATRDIAAFRYKDLLYALDAGTPVNQIEARLKTMADFYGDAERDRTREAEAILRDALKHAPLNGELRNTLLNLYYDRAVAEQALAKEKLVQVARLRIDPPPPGGYVITNEIDKLKQVLGRPTASGGSPSAGGYAFALQGYFELLQDPMGVSTGTVDGNVTDGRPFGLYVFQQEVPFRSLYSATYIGAGGTQEPVVSGGPLFAGWKDLTMLFDVLSTYADAAATLARLYAMRADTGDRDSAFALMGEVQQEVDIAGNTLLGLFDPASLPGTASASGLQDAIAAWRQASTTLQTTRDFLTGGTNLLGFDPNFLMLVQRFQGTSGDLFDSFDSLDAWIKKDGTAPLNYALTKYGEARTSYESYRGHQDQLATQFSDRQTGYNQRLFKIVGDNRGGPGYGTPETNVGSEINLQITSRDVAMLRIEMNAARIDSLQKQVEYEVDRRGKERGIQDAMSRMMLDYGDKQASLTIEISEIAAAQAAANSAAQAIAACRPSANDPIGWTWASSAHAANGVFQHESELAKGRLQAKKERLAAQERASLNDMGSGILDINSEALIKTWLLQMSTLSIESLEAQLLLTQENARLVALYDEKTEIERRMDRENSLLASRYFADPVHLLRMQTDTIEADETFEEAQKWVFFLARAWEYKWNAPFVHTHGGRGWTTGSLYRLRNAEELQAMVAALENKNGLLEGSLVKDDYFDWFSVRDDFFGYRYMVNNVVQYYRDPVTGEMLDALAAFRRQLTRMIDANGNITLDFSTVREIPGGTFFRGPRFSNEGQLISKGTYLDKVKWIKIALPGAHTTGTRPITGQLTYGGTSYLRNQDIGVPDPLYPGRPDMVKGEMTPYSTRYWYFHSASDLWRFNEGLSVPAPMQRTTDPRIPPSATEIDGFKERSVAATGWKLLIPTQDLGQTLLKINELNDIELYFYHYAVSRP